MAKSLRASNKVKARNARRYTPTSDYAVTQAARLDAISKRLAQRVNQPKLAAGSLQENKDQSGGEVEEATEQDEEEAGCDEVKGMDDVEEQTTKISTSGPRNSRRELWKKARGWKTKPGSKNGGKPKRRR